MPNNVGVRATRRRSGRINGSASAAPVQATIFNTLHADMVSFNDGRGVVVRTTGTAPAGYCSARANNPLPAGGKFAWRTVIAPGRAASVRAAAAGVGTTSASLSTFLGGDVNGWSLLCDTSNNYLYHNNVFTSNWGDVIAVAGDYLDVAVDLTAGHIWYGINGAWQAAGNPATGANPAQTGLTGTLYPMVSGFWGSVIYLDPLPALTLPSGFSPLP